VAAVQPALDQDARGAPAAWTVTTMPPRHERVIAIIAPLLGVDAAWLDSYLLIGHHPGGGFALGGVSDDELAIAGQLLDVVGYLVPRIAGQPGTHALAHRLAELLAALTQHCSPAPAPRNGNRH
jgi:hypothetical protein